MEKEPVSGIYMIVNLFNNKEYVGGTNNLNRRKIQHFSDLHRNRSGSILMQQDWNELKNKNYPVEAWFYFSVIEEVLVENLLEREQYWLDTLKPFYNTNKIAGRYIGEYIRTPEALAKRKESRKGKHPRISEEVTQKRRERWAGDNNPNRKRVFTPEDCEKLRQQVLGPKNPNYGKPRSEETKAKLRSHGRVTYHNILSPDGTLYETVTNISQFCRDHDLGVSSMVAVLHHRKKSHKGWTCTDVLSEV